MLVPNKIVETYVFHQYKCQPIVVCTIRERVAEFGNRIHLAPKAATVSLETSAISEVVLPLLHEFQDIFPDDLVDRLPSFWDIQHYVELQLSSILPHRPRYRMSPKEYEELRH